MIAEQIRAKITETKTHMTTKTGLKQIADSVEALELRITEMVELVEASHHLLKQSHAMEVNVLKKRNAELVGALRFLCNATSGSADELGRALEHASDTLAKNGGGV